MIDIRTKVLAVGMGAVGAIAGLALAIPAQADPIVPVPPVPQPPVLNAPVQAVAADPSALPPLNAPVQTVAADPSALPPEGVPHLASPENLPPGTIDGPVAPTQPRLGYLRDLWQAVQTQEVSGSDALLLLTQRPMNANATPPPGMRSGPQPPQPAAPLPPAEPALPVVPLLAP